MIWRGWIRNENDDAELLQWFEGVVNATNAELLQWFEGVANATNLRQGHISNFTLLTEKCIILSHNVTVDLSTTVQCYAVDFFFRFATTGVS